MSGNPVHASLPAERSRPWSARAFGLVVGGGLRLDSLVVARGDGPPDTRVERTPRHVLEAHWRTGSPRPLLERRVAGGAVGLTVQHDEQTGYRVWAPRHGAWIVAPDGRTVTGSPPSGPRWRWERLVLAQALPLAALLQGVELLHAGAVCLDDRAVALLGPSGAGKTTIAMQLVARGARLLTDDVLAVTADGASVWGHRGGAVARVETAAMRRMSPAQRAALGDIEARGAKWHVRPPAGPARARLGALYILTRASNDAGVAIRPMRPVDPGILLGSAFLPYLDAGDRLCRQLDVAAAIAAAVPLHAVDAGRRAGPSAAAEALMAHAYAVLSRTTA